MPGFVICPYCGATVQALTGPDGRKLCPVCSNQGKPPAPAPAYAQPAYAPQAQPYYPPPAYYGGQPPNVPGAVGSLVCGILAVLTGFVGLILGPIALVQGNNALREVQSYPGRYGGEGMARAGKILGIVGIAVGALNVIIFIVAFSSAFEAFSNEAPDVEMAPFPDTDRVRVTSAEPGLSWSEFDVEGSAQCTLPAGDVDAGDVVTCLHDGSVTVTHRRSHEVVFSGFV